MGNVFLNVLVGGSGIDVGTVGDCMHTHSRRLRGLPWAIPGRPMAPLNEEDRRRPRMNGRGMKCLQPAGCTAGPRHLLQAGISPHPRRLEKPRLIGGVHDPAAGHRRDFSSPGSSLGMLRCKHGLLSAAASARGPTAPKGRIASSFRGWSSYAPCAPDLDSTG